MEKLEFKKLLFKVACCTMACDGEIDKREIEELKLINTSTFYFKDVDLSGELSAFIDELKAAGVQAVNNLLDSVKSFDLNLIQELLILEVAIRIINADKRHDENEIRFIRQLRRALNLHDEMIKDRFGDVPLLKIRADKNVIAGNKEEGVFFEEITLSDIASFDEIAQEFK